MINSVYTLIYIIAKNHCYSRECCNNCRCLDTKFSTRVCRLKYMDISVIEKILLLIPPINARHPLWGVVMKQCNNNYRYGRFDSCKKCVFFKDKWCIFRPIWGRINK